MDPTIEDNEIFIFVTEGNATPAENIAKIGFGPIGPLSYQQSSDEVARDPVLNPAEGDQREGSSNPVEGGTNTRKSTKRGRLSEDEKKEKSRVNASEYRKKKKEEVELLKERVDTLTSENEVLQQEREDCERKNEDLQRKNGELQRRNGDLVSENRNLQQKNGGLQRENAELMRRMHANEQAANEQMTNEEVAILLIENGNLRVENAKMEGQIQSYTAMLPLLQKILNMDTSRVNELQVETAQSMGFTTQVDPQNDVLDNNLPPNIGEMQNEDLMQILFPQNVISKDKHT